MKFCQELNGYMFKTKASHLDGGHRLWSGLERDGLHHTTLRKTHHMKMTTTTQSIPAQSSPGTKTALAVAGHQDGGERYATDGPKLLRARNNITIGTWNVRLLRAAGKVEKLTHEMKKYWWNIRGLCEVCWKHFGETSTPEGHKLFFSDSEDRYEHGVRFLIHQDNVNAIMGCRPVSSGLITICLKASPFNITIIQAYAPTTDCDDDDIEDFYDHLQNVIDQVPKKDILLVQGDWNAKMGEDTSKKWKGTCGPYRNPATNERGLTLLEFASYNNVKVVYTFGPHKPSRHWTQSHLSRQCPSGLTQTLQGCFVVVHLCCHLCCLPWFIHFAVVSGDDLGGCLGCEKGNRAFTAMHHALPLPSLVLSVLSSIFL